MGSWGQRLFSLDEYIAKLPSPHIVCGPVYSGQSNWKASRYSVLMLERILLLPAFSKHLVTAWVFTCITRFTWTPWDRYYFNPKSKMRKLRHSSFQGLTMQPLMLKTKTKDVTRNHFDSDGMDIWKYIAWVRKLWEQQECQSSRWGVCTGNKEFTIITNALG